MAIQFIGYRMNSNSLKRKIDTLMVDNLTQLSERVDLTMDIYTNLVYQIYVDDKIIENVNILMEREAGEREVAFHTIYNRLQQAEKSVKGVRCISVICSNGQSVTYDAGTGSSIENLWDDYGDLREIAPYRDVQGQPGMLVTPTTRYKGYDGDEYYFHISKCMYDYNNLDKGVIATIVMSVDESVLRDICAVAIAEDEAEYNINFITDRTGFVISYPNPFYTGINMNPKLSVQEFVSVTGLLKGQNTAVNTYVNEHRGWVYYNVYNKDYMMRDIRNNQIMFIVISLTAILFSSVLICYIVRRIGSSVALITDGIDQVKEGNLNVSVALESRDELGQIASNFNDMTGKVRNLVAEVSQAKDQQKNAEIRALEAQINPHFLYNTLDSINWMAIEKEEYEISRMLRNLGVILRYSVNQSNQMASVSEVADWLEKYVSLQQMRFNQSFRFSLNVTEEARKVMIYKLLLQPFVENAIIHGFKGTEKGGVLRVDLFLSETGERLNIIIEDNGKGMSREMAESFNVREQAVKDEGGSIGLHNAFARMDMYYGKEAVWNVNSIEGMGTVVTLTLPVNRPS
ncbi:HAMP domain-containing protein [Enterocloster citroniae]|uniref:HAMP domain-containing protein n=1 Tax=Enterocloster citroniae TaxID=358743 RepID=A0AA41FJ54_9FIRM|nr:HAMP domain-containing protein [Enterocloster citroniae]MCC3382948.1 HAMP domain-containing protein [Enterocloster citroniae]RGC12129.1 sensor histidine kinase [Enterocloster citroniae]